MQHHQITLLGTLCLLSYAAATTTSAAASWAYDATTGDLSITLNDGSFSTGAPTFEAWVDKSSGSEFTADTKKIGQAGGSTVVTLSNLDKTATINALWTSHFKLDASTYAIFIRVYNANNSLNNLMQLTNTQGLTVLPEGALSEQLLPEDIQWATLLTASVTESTSVACGDDIRNTYRSKCCGLAGTTVLEPPDAGINSITTCAEALAVLSDPGCITCL